jgi:hypothetical protein
MTVAQYVRHPNRPEWGVGQVLSLSGTKATVNFMNAGVRTIDVGIVPLAVVDDSEKAPFRVDLVTLERLCRQFYSDMEHNRRGVDDGGMAREVLEQMNRRGSLNKSTEKRLLDWCYTDGAVFQAGVDLARRICITIYGVLLPDPDSRRPRSK